MNFNKSLWGPRERSVTGCPAVNRLHRHLVRCTVAKANHTHNILLISVPFEHSIRLSCGGLRSELAAGSCMD